MEHPRTRSPGRWFEPRATAIAICDRFVIQCEQARLVWLSMWVTRAVSRAYDGDRRAAQPWRSLSFGFRTVFPSARVDWIIKRERILWKAAGWRILSFGHNSCYETPHESLTTSFAGRMILSTGAGPSVGFSSRFSSRPATIEPICSIG